MWITENNYILLDAKSDYFVSDLSYEGIEQKLKTTT